MSHHNPVEKDVVYYTYGGRTLTVFQWANQLGLTVSGMYHRLEKVGSGKLALDECFTRVKRLEKKHGKVEPFKKPAWVVSWESVERFNIQFEEGDQSNPALYPLYPKPAHMK